MSLIAQFGRPRSGLRWPLILVLLCVSACSRPSANPADQSAVQSDHHTPFHDSNSPATPAPAEPMIALAASDHPSSGGGKTPPFHDVQSLPAGTFVSVRLTGPVYAESSIAAAAFQGEVAEPIIIDGTTVIPRGALVSGLVEGVRASEVKPSRGYVRLTLQSLQIGGSEIPLHTQSLFAPQASAHGAGPSLIRLEKGRQLTFRLSEPAYTHVQEAQK